MSTPPLRVNGLQIVAHAAPSGNGWGPFPGIQIAIQKEPPPHSGSGGVLWSDGETLHWSTTGRDVELPRITGSQLLAVDDVDAVLQAQTQGQIVAGAIGAGSVLTVLALVRIGQWVAAWVAA